MANDQIVVGQITNADVYIDGGRHVGLVKTFNIDGVGYETVENRSLGMVGALKLPARTLEPIEAKVKFAWLDAKLALKTWMPNAAVSFTFEQFVDIFDQQGLDRAKGHRIITMVDLLFSKRTADEMANSNESQGVEHECSVIRLTVKSTLDDVFLQEFAPFDGINRINGVDVWPTY